MSEFAPCVRVFGDTELMIGVGLTTVTVVLTDTVGSATLVAVTTTLVGSVAGAV